MYGQMISDANEGNAQEGKGTKKGGYETGRLAETAALPGGTRPFTRGCHGKICFTSGWVKDGGVGELTGVSAL